MKQRRFKMLRSKIDVRVGLEKLVKIKSLFFLKDNKHTELSVVRSMIEALLERKETWRYIVLTEKD